MGAIRFKPISLIPGLEEFKGYVISSKGDVYSYQKRSAGAKLKHYPLGSKGRDYPAIDLQIKGKRKTVKVHRLVALSFIDNINDYPQVDHIDRNRFNPDISNLRWVTNSMNVKHSYDGRKTNQFTGSNNPKNILNEEQVKEIYQKAINREITQKQLAKKYNVNLSTIQNIKYKKTWKHIL